MLDFLMYVAPGCFLIVFFVMLGYGIGYIPRFLLSSLLDRRHQPPDRSGSALPPSS